MDNQEPQWLTKVRDYIIKNHGDLASDQNQALAGSTLGDDTHGLQGVANNIAAGGDGTLPDHIATPEEMEQAAQGLPVKGYADGGVIDAPPTFDPNSGMPPPPPVASPAAPAQDPGFANYLAQQKAQLNRFGPDQQQAVTNTILQGQNSLQSRAGNAVAGLGDALLGVAGKSSPGFQANLQNKMNNQANLQMEGLKNASEANLQNLSATEKLDEQDPNSPISKITAKGYAPLSKLLGVASFDGMPAGRINSMVETLAQLGGKQMEVAVARMKAQIEARRDAEMGRHNAATESIESKKAATEAANLAETRKQKGEEIHAGELEKASSIPVMSRVAAAFGGNPAAKALENEALGVKEISGPEDYAKLTPGDQYSFNGTLHRKK